MAKIDKLIKRMKSVPKDFTFDELRRVLESLGFRMSNKGKTSGSRVCFKKDSVPIILHKPHPGNILSTDQIKDVLSVLKSEGLI